MKSKMTLIAMALFATIAGCGRDDDKMNDALANDLSLAAQQQPAQLDSISAVERGLTASPATTPRSAATTTRRTTSTAPRRTASTSSSSTSSGATSTGTASQPRETVVKHTKRDAAIGAAAGAVIGATTSKDKVKGAVIGAAAGGILGAVIGNNVDVKKKKTP
jgi:hypothetical protein